jgi:FkbM family methyltransferase
MGAHSALHERALDHLGHGEAESAIELLREAIADALDPELVNDLAVILATSGEPDQARELLRGLLLMCPDCAPAQENLRSLAAIDEDGAGAQTQGGATATPDRATADADAARPHPVRGAPGGPAADGARAAFLQVVADAQARILPDNLDPLFHPWGHELPSPEGLGGRLADQLTILERAVVLWRQLGDDVSRRLWLRFLAYRALGPAHVRLQLDPIEYRRAVIALTAQMMRQPAVIPTSGMPFEWGMHHYDLHASGLPIQVIGPPLPLASTYCFSQYAYRDPVAGARPRPGDVAIDAGGCWGDTALWLAHVVGASGTVHTFEPSPRNRELLGHNLQLNPELAPRVRVHAAPLGRRPGETIWMDDIIAAGATAREQAREDARSVRLQTDTIDALVQAGTVERVDFIKVDVEGADLDVLQGAANTIVTQRPRLAIAAYHRPDDLVAIPDFIASLGVEYRWYLQCSTMTDVDTVAFAVPA